MYIHCTVHEFNFFCFVLYCVRLCYNFTVFNSCFTVQIIRKCSSFSFFTVQIIRKFSSFSFSTVQIIRKCSSFSFFAGISEHTYVVNKISPSTLRDGRFWVFAFKFNYEEKHFWFFYTKYCNTIWMNNDVVFFRILIPFEDKDLHS